MKTSKLSGLIIISFFLSLIFFGFSNVYAQCKDDNLTILKSLGFKGWNGVTPEHIAELKATYQRAFNSTNPKCNENGDGKLSLKEYINCAGYGGPGMLSGIFNAADRNKDGYMTEHEYVENRILTDECKRIYCAMKKSGCLRCVPYCTPPFPPEKNPANALSLTDFAANTDFGECTEQVFNMFDRNEAHGIWQLEWLRVWGHLARENATLNIEKAKVSWDDSNIELKGEFIPLKKKSWEDNPFGIVIVILAGKKVVEQRVDFKISGDKLEYKDEKNLNGNIGEFEVDCEGEVAGVKLKIAVNSKLFPEGAGSSPAKLECILRVGDDTYLATGSDLIGI